MNILGILFKVVRAGATLWTVATAIVISPAQAVAGVDLTLGSSFRSYPLSGVLEVEVGYGARLWGKPTTPFSGYLRPRVQAASALVYNSADAALEFFPLAFMGVRGGGEMVQNDHDYSAYDCQNYRCMGRFHRAYVETELTLGARPIFVQWRWRRERWSQPDPLAGDFIDPTSGLAMDSAGEAQTLHFGVLGLRFTPSWSMLIVLRNAESSRRQFSRTPFALLRYKTKSATIGLGGGVFESALKKQEPTIMAVWRWEIRPSLALR